MVEITQQESMEIELGCFISEYNNEVMYFGIVGEDSIVCYGHELLDKIGIKNFDYSELTLAEYIHETNEQRMNIIVNNIKYEIGLL